MSIDRYDERAEVARLVVSKQLQQNFLHHVHASLRGRHHGVKRTYQRIRANFRWRGLYRSVQTHVKTCVV